MRKHDDDDDTILRDGETRRCSMMMRDSADASRSDMRKHFARLSDGRGGTPGHRPGFAFADASRQARERAYSDYDKSVSEAWRARPIEQDSAMRDAGHLKMINGVLTVVSDPAGGSQADAGMLDATAQAYRDYDLALANSWRSR
jgi:hypothetical protein